MAIYILTVLIPVALGMAAYRERGIRVVCQDRTVPFSDDRRNRLFLFTTFAALLFIAVFRSERIGTDYHAYLKEYRSEEDWYNTFEPLYNSIQNWAGRLFQGEAAGLAFVVAAVYLGGTASLLLRNVEGRELFYCVMVFVMNPYMYMLPSFNSMRQSLAVGFVLLGFRFLQSRRWAVFALIVAAAQLIHANVIYLAILIPMAMIPWNRKTLAIIVVAAFALSCALNDMQALYDRLSFIPSAGRILEQATPFDFMLYRVFILAVSLAMLRWYNKLFDGPREKFFIDLFILSLCVLQVAIKNDFIYRIYCIIAIMALPAVAIALGKTAAFAPRVRRWLPLPLLGYYALKMALFFWSLDGSGRVKDYLPFRFLWM